MRYTICTLFLTMLCFVTTEVRGQLMVPQQQSHFSSDDDQRQRRTRDREQEDFNRWVFGGGLGFGFGNNTFVNVSPQVGYRVSQNLTVGSGIEWFYQSFSNSDNSFRSFGPTLWAQFLPAQEIYLGVNYVYADQRLSQFGSDLDDTDHILWLGGGYIQRTGGNGALLIGGQYNIISDNDGIMRDSRFRPQISFLYGI